MTLDDAEYLTIEDAAERLHEDPETVRHWMRSSQLSGVNLGPAGWRVRRTDLERLILARRRQGDAAYS